MSDLPERPTPHAKLARAWQRYRRFWGPRAEADVDEELRFHIEMRVSEYMTRGLSEADARDATARRLGDLALARAEMVSIRRQRDRRERRATFVDALVQDVRFALRTLARQPGWTAVAVLTLTLGIGANAAMFSVVNSLLLHPLPYPDADRVRIVYQQPSGGAASGVLVTISPSPKVVRAWRERSRSFEDLEAYATTDATLQPRGAEPVLMHTASILPTLPRLAGARPLVGRVLTADDVRAHVVMLGEGVWRTRFGADPGAVGQTLTLDGTPYTIVGVMPADFRLPRLMQDETDLWLPLDLDQDALALGTVGRLRRGVSVAAATRELDAIAASVSREQSDVTRFDTKIVAPQELVHFRDSLLLLTAAVALVLLIACANVAHLLLARATRRQRELAIRAALGAARGRIFRQLLTESVVLALLGCAGGIALGWLGVRTIVRLRPDALAALGAAHLDGAVVVATVAVALASGLAFGLLGGLQASRHSTHETLKAGARSVSQSRRDRRLRGLLAASEMALSTTLIIGATLLIRSVIHLQRTDPGFDATGLYSMDLTLPNARYDRTARAAFVDQIVQRARTLPGVRAVTIGAAPGFRSFLVGALQIDDDPPPPTATTSFIDFSSVDPDYFRVMGIRLVGGTSFTDTSTAAAQVLVNEGLARRRWPGRSALGHRLRVVFNGQGDWRTIVGVVADASIGGLTAEASAPMLYLPPGEHSFSSIIVRTSGTAIPIPALRALVWSMNAHLPPPRITSVQDALAKSIEGPRFTMTLLATFTALALVLAAIGLYGVMAYAVAQRTREIGIRMALGATRRSIARAVVAEGLSMALLGAAIGAGAALWATRLLRHLLYGVGPTDPLSFALGTVVLVATAVVACVVPMSRAVAIDPLSAIRAE